MSYNQNPGSSNKESGKSDLEIRDKLTIGAITSPEIWKAYLDQKNDRSNIAEDDEIWGINTEYIAAHLGLPYDIATGASHAMRLFRERVILLLQRRDLKIAVDNAFSVFQPDSNSPDWNYLNLRGVIHSGIWVFDLLVPVTVRKGEPDFDFFFAVKLAQVDLMHLDKFLEYQLRASFTSDFSLFERFLNTLLQKYNAGKTGGNAAWPVISSEIRETVQGWLSQFTNKNPKASMYHTPPISMTMPQLINRQWALLFHYALEALDSTGRANPSAADIARFMHLVMGKPFTKIQNSEIYGHCRNVFSDRRPNVLIEDLETIKLLFEQVGMTKAVESIDEKIKELRKK
jgi:hypothetical protein